MNTSEVAFTVIGANVPVALGWDLIRRHLTAGRITAHREPSVPRALPAPSLMSAPPPPLAPVPQPAARPAGTATAAFAATLKALRTSQGLSTRALGEMAGLDGSTVSNAENGRTVTLETAAMLAAALGAGVDSMITGERQEAAS